MPGGTQVRYGPLALDVGNLWPFSRDFVRAYIQALTAGGILGTNLAALSGVKDAKTFLTELADKLRRESRTSAAQGVLAVLPKPKKAPAKKR